MRLRRVKSLDQSESRYPTPDPGILSTLYVASPFIILLPQEDSASHWQLDVPPSIFPGIPLWKDTSTLGTPSTRDLPVWELPGQPRRQTPFLGPEPDSRLQGAWGRWDLSGPGAQSREGHIRGRLSRQPAPLLRPAPPSLDKAVLLSPIFTLCICQPSWLVQEAPSSLQRQKGWQNSHCLCLLLFRGHNH